MEKQPLARVAQGAFLPLITRRPVAICMFMVAIAVLGVVSFTKLHTDAELAKAKADKKTTDKKAAEAFYSAVVGWQTKPFEGARQPYTTFNRSGDTGVAGVLSSEVAVVSGILA